MRNYQGAVLFVDMLGFSALTRGKIPLTSKELGPWKVGRDTEFSHQHLAARIILAFRTRLAATRRQHTRVKVAQLSDCAFLWSSDLKQVVDAGRYLMNSAARAGLLCRGGLAYGDIYEPDKVNHSLGEFIVGDAVTKAATYETAGKGMRIFTDNDTVFRINHDYPNEQFSKSFNALNGDSVDEWRWYFPQAYFENGQNSRQLRADLDAFVACFTFLKHSPLLAWSAKTQEGRRQIACSLYALATAMQDMTLNTSYFLSSIENLELADQPRSTEARTAAFNKILAELSDYIKQAATVRDV